MLLAISGLISFRESFDTDLLRCSKLIRRLSSGAAAEQSLSHVRCPHWQGIHDCAFFLTIMLCLIF